MTDDSPTTETSTEHDQDAPQAAAGRTLRGRLRERRAEAQGKLFLDRDVPRMPGVVVRFKPLPGHRIEQIQKRTEKSKDPEKHTIGAATALAECCLGIYEVVPDETDAVTQTADGRFLASVDLDNDEPPTFDERLARILELGPVRGAVEIVRGFYLTDGDVTAESNALTAWSGFTGEQDEEDWAGN